MIKINELTHIYSELFGCAYAVGKTDEGQYTYVWTEQDIDTEIIDENMIENAECYHGAIVGTLQEVVDEIEECVGGFRFHGDEEQQEEAWDIVEELLSAFGLESREIKN